MDEAGMVSMSAFIRKMALEGYVIKLDLSEMNEFVRLLRINSNNLNQYAKKANETGNIYLADIKELQRQQDELWNAMKEFLKPLSNLT
ncbi:MAG: plasmid mobilization relaxosome protein MobC [Lachnospiraceae bacterium]|nr:plasmid mobilization relaxosome protein MobC [Lachnospiraceae bacterium]